MRHTTPDIGLECVYPMKTHEYKGEDIPIGDSTVFKDGGECIKLYHIPHEYVEEYNKVQRAISEQIGKRPISIEPTYLDESYLTDKGISNNEIRIDKVTFEVLKTPEQVTQFSDITTRETLTESRLPFIEGKSLSEIASSVGSYSNTISQFFGKVVTLINNNIEESFSLDMSVDPEKILINTQISCVNIKILSIIKGELSLMVTDIGTDAIWLIDNNGDRIEDIINPTFPYG